MDPCGPLGDVLAGKVQPSKTNRISPTRLLEEMHMHTLLRLAAILAVPLTLAHCGSSEPPLSGIGAPGAGTSAKYDAQVTRTALGIPHIKSNRADDFGSAGYGLGYSFAEDNLCVFLDDVVTIRGERAEFFGRDGTYTIPANGSTANNVDSDFFWRSLITEEALAKLKSDAAPEALAATIGFKDGINRYISEFKAGGFPGRHAACANGAWLRPLDDDDMFRRYLRLGVLASSSVFVSNIAQAAPPAAGVPAAALPTFAQSKLAIKSDQENGGPLSFFKSEKPFGSNMYALGKEATASGVPMVFGNPHFPWAGTERLYVSHLTVPKSTGGAFDIMGSSLYGVPAILIGFNDKLAWSHTVSTAYRFTFYELTLVPGDPTSYVYGTETLPMEQVPMTIAVQEADGSMGSESRTLYKSKFGPMLTLSTNTPAGAVNLLPWTPVKAYTLRDANFENTRLINQFFKWDAANDLEEFKALHKSVLGVPWVNTVAAGPNSKAYYGDVTVVPNVPDTKAQTCATSAQALALSQLMPGLALLDGSRADCEWDTDADAPAPGIFGGGNLPTLERDDWVHNCNDSYWVTNPAEPLTGFASIIGAEETERSLRTRLCMLQVIERLAGTDGLPGDKFDMDNLQEIVLSSRIYSAELARDEVISSICAVGTVLTSGGPVDVSEACAVLANWSTRNNLDDVGGHIWREFFRSVAANTAVVSSVSSRLRWLTPFSATDPVNTPNTLNVLSPLVQQALGNAVTAVTNAGVAMDAPLGSLQRSGVIGDNNVPVFGGIGSEGAFTIITAPPLSAAGYPINYGNSYIQTVTWSDNGPNAKVQAEGFITYSQSTDPANPHYFDFTQEYSAKRWHRFPFAAADVQAQKVSERRLFE